jgi:hypothetical protein
MAMYFIPLTQSESVELVIHALRAAGGQADCSACPARRVCMKQCLAIADSVQRMLRDGTLPCLDPATLPAPPETPQPAPPGGGRRGGLTVIK